MKSKPLVIITGPTSVGKTNLSIKIASEINAEIISADSMQVYRKMDIGTAKIRPEEMSGIRHHLIDILEPDVPFNVALFCELAHKAIEDIYSRGKIPLIVGGTGFYIQALLYGIDFSKGDENEEYRKSLYDIIDKKGNDYLHAMLKEVDSESAAIIHPNNVKRVIRALEFYNETGYKISDHNYAESQKSSEYNFAYFVINDEREKIYSRINARVDEMVKDGLFDEVLRLCDGGYANCQSMLGIGYKEVVDYINSLCSREEAIDNIKKQTRHYAKKQLTWFKREKEVIWLNKYDFDDFDKDVSQYILNILSSKNIYSIH